MKKQTIRLIGLALCLVALYGSYRSYAYDHRTANSLSAFCRIDFRGIKEESEQAINSATLEIVDFRYASAPLSPWLQLTLDGTTYTSTEVRTSAQAPAYAPSEFTREQPFTHTNTLFVRFDPAVLQHLRNAQHVSVSFQYTDSNAPITLPLNAPDLQYWKNQLQ